MHAADVAPSKVRMCSLSEATRLYGYIDVAFQSQPSYVLTSRMRDRPRKCHSRLPQLEIPGFVWTKNSYAREVSSLEVEANSAST